MRTIMTLPLLAIAMVFFLNGPRAQAYEVGDTAACVVLNQIAPDGSMSEHCIRDTAATGEAKVLEFFSATCSDCQASLPVVSSLADRLAGKATVRLVGIDRSEALIRGFLDKNRSLIHFEVALDTDHDAKRTYDVKETPTLYVLDRSNKVLFKHTGVLTDQVAGQIEAIVGGQQ